MKRHLPIITLLIVAAPHLWAAEPGGLPEPGPEDGGLRLRLVVLPRTDQVKEGYDVRVDILNTSGRAITLRAAWTLDRAGDVKDYIEAATSFDCVPAVRRWTGGVITGQRKSPQPEQVLKAGEILSAQWQTTGRHLKNRVANPNEVQNPEFPVPGLYSVHATLNIVTSERTVRLRSNEQLVCVGGSRLMPKSTHGQVWQAAPDGKTATVNLGSLHKIEPGDQFEHLSKSAHWKLTITEVAPEHSTGNLELLFPATPTSPPPGMEMTLILKK